LSAIRRLPAVAGQDCWRSDENTNGVGSALVAPTWPSVFTVDTSNDHDHPQETSIPAIGQPWSTQDLYAKYGTPPV
jgi:hypothetical protein